MIPKDGRFLEIVKEAREKLQLQIPVESLRLLEIYRSRHVRDLNHQQLLSANNGTTFYMEEILAEELHRSQNDKVVPVLHFTKDASRTHGIPFRIVLHPGELFDGLKKRVQSRLAIGDKEFSKVKIAIITYAENEERLRYVEEGKPPISLTIGTNENVVDSEALCDNWLPTQLLGLDHPDRSAASRRFGGVEKAIKIHN
jgi:ubiquitin carboxyl-terminal hydrolase 7